jgi:Cof subfamily protein (haloacid dehalogenase superfamily)
VSYRMIAIDLDDTLLDENWNISPGNLAALREADEAGAQVVLCSGRPTPSMLRYAREVFGSSIPTGRYMISFNGASIMDLSSGEEIFRLGVPLPIARELVVFARHHGITAQAYDGDRFFVEKANDRAEFYKASAGMEYDAVGPLEEFMSVEPLKILFNAPHEELKAIYDEAKALSGGGTPILFEGSQRPSEEDAKRFHVAFSKPHFLEFLNPAVNKGRGVQWLAERLDIPREQVISMGDSGNDVEMLEYAGLGIAVANARNGAAEAADIVMAESNLDDAVATAIHRHLLT